MPRRVMLLMGVIAAMSLATVLAVVVVPAPGADDIPRCTGVARLDARCLMGR